MPTFAEQIQDKSGMIKALFFDIDGTLVSFKTHKIPQSTIDAIGMAKNKGIKIYISTGRPYSLIDNIEEIKPFVDGYITTNGAYCFIGEQVISCSPIPEKDVRKVLGFADEMDFSTMIVGEKDLITYRCNDAARHIFQEILNVSNIDTGIPVESMLKQPVLQLTPVISENTEQQIMPLLQGCTCSRWCPDFADITARNANKGNGLLAVIGHEHIQAAETMAFGDGGNDIPIIQTAGIGIAMGNANERLKSVADYVTTSVDEDGIFQALKHWIF